MLHIPLGRSPCQSLCAVKLNAGFSSSPGLVFSLGVRSDTTNSSCTAMPPLMPVAAFWTLAEFLFLLLIIGLTKSCRPALPSKKPWRLANALSSFADTIKNSRVDVFADHSVLIHAWNKQAGRSHAFSDSLKAICEALMATICSLRLSRVPSAQNPADPPARSLFQADSRPSDACWERLQVVFGGTNGHSVDLMAPPSNAMYGFTGAKLPLFSSHPTPGCHGVNLLSQSPDLHPPLLFSNP